jgi:type II secretory pathway pseudopilin PulG
MMAARRRSRRASNSGGFGALFALLVVVAIIIKFIWWILGALALVGFFFLTRAVVRENRKQRDAYARHCAQISARADQQHNWVMRGDDRGVYGPDGATLMHFIEAPPRAS